MTDPRKELVEKMALSVVSVLGKESLQYMRMELVAKEMLQVVLDAIEAGEVVELTGDSFCHCDKNWSLKPAFRRDAKCASTV
jgi:hypothetical protein